MAQLDVLIVGAGLAGLRTAHLLRDKGYTVKVVEANNRVGGRTTGVEWNDYQWDLGGQWVGPTQDRLYALIKQLGMSTFPQFLDGRKGYMVKDGAVKTYAGLIPPVSPIALLEVQFLLWDFEAILKSFPIDRNLDIWKDPEAKKWDGMTVETWMNNTLSSQSSKNLITQMIRAVLTVEPKDVSFLYWLHYLRGAGSSNGYGSAQRLVEVPNGAQQDRIKGGSYMVSQRMADQLGKDIVITEEPVIEIKQDNEKVEVKTRSGKVFIGKYVVMACSPTMTSRIQYDPPLPSDRDELTQRISMGRVIKCLAFYSESFWRKKGLSGEFVSEDGTLTMGFDASLPDGSAHALVGFVCGEYARKLSLLSQEERKQLVVECFSKFFGEEALSPIHYMDKDWCSEQWARGAYTSVAPPGVLSSLGDSLRKPIGRIHFAGTETAKAWTGYMEGALESAERVVDELESRFKNPSWKPQQLAIYPKRKRVTSTRTIIQVIIVAMVAIATSIFINKIIK